MTEQAAKTRIPLDEARALADEVVDLLEVVTERIAIGGSIRRQRETVGDLEIVAIPRYEEGVTQVDMFTQATSRLNLLDARCRDFLERGTFAHRLDKNQRPAFGERYKRLTYKGFPLDLFSATEENWGVILLIRTGPSEFSRRFVTRRSQGGLLPNDLRVEDGAVWRGVERLPTPEEPDCFRLVGLSYIPAERREEASR